MEFENIFTKKGINENLNKQNPKQLFSVTTNPKLSVSNIYKPSSFEVKL